MYGFSHEIIKCYVDDRRHFAYSYSIVNSTVLLAACSVVLFVQCRLKEDPWEVLIVTTKMTQLFQCYICRQIRAVLAV